MADSRPWHPAIALSGADYSAVELDSDGTRAFVLDQLRLPNEESYPGASMRNVPCSSDPLTSSRLVVYGPRR